MKKIGSAMEKHVEKLSDEAIADFKEVVANTEALLKATANQGGEKLAEIRAKAEESLRVAKDRMEGAQAALLANSKAAVRAADAYVHENPWKAVGAAVGVGLVIAFLIDRQCHRD